MRKIFINYRHADAEYAAGALARDLRRHFGDDKVFRDKEDIEGGTPWRQRVLDAIDHQSALLVLIGKTWVSARAENGGRRLDDLHDPVRVEILDAGRDGATIVPVLLEGTPMPSAAELPPELAYLRELTAVPLRDSDWQADLLRICARLEQAGFWPDRARAQRSRPRGMPIKLIASYATTVFAVVGLVMANDASRHRGFALIAFVGLLLAARSYQEYRNGKSNALWLSLCAIGLGTCVTSAHAISASTAPEPPATAAATEARTTAVPLMDPALPLTNSVRSATAPTSRADDPQPTSLPVRLNTELDIAGRWVDADDRMPLVISQNGRRVHLEGGSPGEVRGDGYLTGRRLTMTLRFANRKTSELVVDLAPDGQWFLGTYLVDGKPVRARLQRL